MASISSVSGSSSAHSIYGSRNILTGLASGLDTESMIENSIQGYKLKIQNLIGQQTKLTWKQDAVRSVTDKMIALSQKYTSYTSKTNLTSPSFFSNAVITTTSGDNADKASATGKSTSDVKINAVKQLARAARYSVSAAERFGVDGTATGAKLNLSQAKVSKLSGSMTLSVGRKSVELTFDRTEAYENAQEFVDAINAKLGEQTIGDVKASEMISAKLENGSIKFEAGAKAEPGDSVWVSGASGSIEKTLGLKPTTNLESGKSQTSVTAPTGSLYDIQGPVQALSNQTLNVTLDGVTKKVSLGDLTVTDEDRANGIDSLEDKLLSNIQDGLKSAFGSKVGVELKDGALSFSTSSQGSSLKVSSTVGKALGLGSNGVSNYLDTGKTLGEILGRGMGGLESLDAVGDESKYKLDGEKGTDAAGNSIMRIGGKWKRVDSEGNQLYGLTINGEQVGAFSTDSALDSVISAINRSEAGVKVNYSQLTNKLTFSATETGAQGRIDFGEGLAAKLFGSTGLNQTDKGVLLDSEGNPLVAGYGENGEEYYLKQDEEGRYWYSDKHGVEIEDPNSSGRFPTFLPELDSTDPVVTAALTNARKGFTAGQDAIFSATVNGDELTLTRSSNTVAIDGLNVTLKGVFNDKAEGEDGASYFERGADGQIRFTGADKIKAGSEVTFSSKADADTIVDAIKTFVEEYNAIAKEAHDAYSTQPLSKSSNVNNYRTYEPLTDEDKEGMSDSEIERYEEKAKTGILFGDGDMRRAYDSLRSAITVYGDDRKAMEAIGLTTSYSDGVTSLSLDEDKLRAALDANPDQVQRVFTDSIETGASSNGLMARVKKTMDTYASTSIGKYGVLVSKAGTRTSSLTLMHNSFQDQIDRLDNQIDTWQTRMSNQIDYYTRQFTALEQLINEMNSQSSALAGLMGGSGY